MFSWVRHFLPRTCDQLNLLPFQCQVSTRQNLWKAVLEDCEQKMRFVGSVPRLPVISKVWKLTHYLKYCLPRYSHKIEGSLELRMWIYGVSRHYSEQEIALSISRPRSSWHHQFIIQSCIFAQLPRSDVWWSRCWKIPTEPLRTCTPPNSKKLLSL